MSAETEPQVAQALQKISTSVSALVSEEIALAKAEVGGKVKSLGIGAGVGAAAGGFLFFAFILLSHGIAFLLYEIVGGGIFVGFFLAALLYLVLAGIAGFFALRLLKKGAPPVPELAIAEAKLTKEAVTEARRNA